MRTVDATGGSSGNSLNFTGKGDGRGPDQQQVLRIKMPVRSATSVEDNHLMKLGIAMAGHLFLGLVVN